MISRRAALTGAIGLATTRLVRARDGRSERLVLDVRDAVRVLADSDPLRSAPWWYEISIYALQPAKPPLLLMRAEGCEHAFARPRDDRSYTLRNSTLSAFKDPSSGAWIDQFDNPLTGRQNTVKPNIVEGGATIIGPDGRTLFRDNSDMKPSQISGGEVQPIGVRKIGALRWLVAQNLLCLEKQGIAGGSYQPLMEVGSTWVRRGELADRRRSCVNATFASSFVSPWMPWMDMADAPGFLLWHSTGRKFRRLDDLPDRFLARAEHLAPGRLGRDPFAGSTDGPAGSVR